jgi:ribonuclease HI
MHENTQEYWQLFVDGASRNNPGASGAGIVLAKNNHQIFHGGFFLGTKTNNQAEYLACIIGLFIATHEFQIKDHLTVYADSELLVRQLNGLYKVKNVLLQPLAQVAKQLMQHCNARIFHIPRSENGYADLMANKGIDLRHMPPNACLQFFAQNSITL